MIDVKIVQAPTLLLKLFICHNNKILVWIELQINAFAYFSSLYYICSLKEPTSVINLVQILIDKLYSKVYVLNNLLDVYLRKFYTYKSW